MILADLVRRYLGVGINDLHILDDNSMVSNIICRECLKICGSMSELIAEHVPIAH